jgi:PAS domain S-box-containing protein
VTGPPLPPIQLLIVEDSDDDAVLLLSRLRRDGLPITHQRVETPRGFEAALRDRPPDVIISDYNMPEFSAEAALKLLGDSGQDVPFILVSGQVGEETAAGVMRSGANDFFLKDRLERLPAAIQRELREAAERRAGRAAHAALRASEERFRLLAEQSQDIIFCWRLGAAPYLDYISPAVSAISGYSPQELYGNPGLLFSLIEDPAPLLASWASPDPEPLVVCWRRPDGTRAWTEQRAVGIKDDAGRLIAVEGILRDVSGSVLAQRDRDRIERQLRQTERLEALGKLAGGVAHDFNNLLAAITGYADLIRPELPSGQAARDLDGVLHAARSGAALTRQLLIFSRLQPTHPETLDLNAIIVETEQLLRRTIGDDVELRVLPHEALPPIMMDRSKLEQIVLNLAVNARAAMPDGGQLTMTTALVVTGDLPTAIRLTVSDTGMGMPPEVAAHAFDPFFSTKPPGQGTGLGLATVYGIVNEAGGTVSLTTEVGVGTTFQIDLPPSAGTVRAADPATTPAADQTGQGETILVVEDEPAVREITTRILTRSAYRVIEAANPAEALRLCEVPGTHLDAILTDAIMPGMSGLQLIDEVRATRPGLPALLMSGYSATSLPGGQSLPPDTPLIHKPFTAVVLLRHLRELLGR